MVIHKILANELLNKELLSFNVEEISEVGKYITNMLVWCSNFSTSICREFINSLEKFIESLIRLRFAKYLLHANKQGESIDVPIMDELISIINDYYRNVVYGLVDNNGNVMVRVLKDFEFKEVRYSKASITSIPLKEALILSKIGYVKLLNELITYQH